MTAVVVLGQVARDLVLRVPEVPAAGSVRASGRREVLGGKGANQAVGLAQLGIPVALVGVVGDDAAGAAVLRQAAADGIDVSAVVRRPRAETALLLDLVEDGGRRRLVEHVPEDVLLGPADVTAAGHLVGGCRLLVLQLQQPGGAIREALRRVPAAAVVVADGAPADDRTRRAVLGRADVVRADAAEAEQLAGRRLAGVEDARAAAADLLAAGPPVVALATGADGDLVTWRGGEVLVPLLGEAVDPTGGGDAYVAGFCAALLGGAGPGDAAWFASACSALAVDHPGGRPALDRAAVRAVVRAARG